MPDYYVKCFSGSETHFVTFDFGLILNPLCTFNISLYVERAFMRSFNSFPGILICFESFYLVKLSYW